MPEGEGAAPAISVREGKVGSDDVFTEVEGVDANWRGLEIVLGRPAVESPRNV